MNRRQLDSRGYMQDESPNQPNRPSKDHPDAAGNEHKKTAPTHASDEKPKPGTPASHPPGPVDNSYDRKTEHKSGAPRQKQNPVQEQANKPGGTPTKIYRPGIPAVPPTPSAVPDSSGPAQATAMEAPPVGWLAVISGPGQGNVLTLSNGINSLGREALDRLQLDFGDQMVSRKNHTTVTYDPRGRKFYIQHGSGTNLTYINDEPVLSPQELQPHTNITIGDTVLRFVALCGEQFNWDHKGTEDAE